MQGTFLARRDAARQVQRCILCRPIVGSKSLVASNLQKQLLQEILVAGLFSSRSCISFRDNFTSLKVHEMSFSFSFYVSALTKRFLRQNVHFHFSQLFLNKENKQITDLSD